jgi:hypothetical protein
MSTRHPYLTKLCSAIAATLALASVTATPAYADKSSSSGFGSGDNGACQLDPNHGRIKHVIYIQFDNVHLTRDNPNVPSDLEQMPHLYSFLKGNGTILEKSYTVLISHTAAGFTSALTGLYPDRMGITESNSYDYYDPSTGVPTYTSAFKYWTSPVAAPTDANPNMVTTGGKNTPAPWVTYTRAGCDVGNVSIANMVLEDANAGAFAAGPTDLYSATKVGDTKVDPYSATGFKAGDTFVVDQGANQETAVIDHLSGYYIYLKSPLTKAHAEGVEMWEPAADPVDHSGDLTTTFGANSAEWQEGLNSQTAPYGSAAATLASTDFVGIAVHCTKSRSSICSKSTNAKPDVLPDEPGGYAGYQALFGAKYVNPAIAKGAAAVDDVYGKTPVADAFGQPGFPGFDSMAAANSLGYVAEMQEAGIPVTYAYLSDLHDNHAGGGAYGPGEADYVAAMQSYDQAFAAFFKRLAADGINQSNTLFVVTADENDHYAGQQVAGCDGVTTACQYNTVATDPHHGVFDLTNNGQSVSTWTGPAAWPPAGANGPLVGEVGYNMGWLLGTSIDGTGYDISFDSAPSFYIDGQLQALDANGNVVVNPVLRDFEHAAGALKAFDPYIDATQLTQVAHYIVDGPTLKALHMVNADPQRNISFTMFAQPDFYFQTYSPCSGKSQGCLNDSYAWIHGDYSPDIGQTWLGLVGPGVEHDGIDQTTWTDHTDIVPTMDDLLGLAGDYQPDGRVITQVVSSSVNPRANDRSFTELGALYKQLNAPYGDFAHSLIVASTNGIQGNDTTYLATEQQIQQLAARRDELVRHMQDALAGWDNGHDEQLLKDGRRLLDAAKSLAGLPVDDQRSDED